MGNKHGNISKYKNVKTLLTMNSIGLNSVSFIATDKDEWFIDVIKHKTKSGIIHECNTIIAKDIERWKQIYLQEGFTL